MRNTYPLLTTAEVSALPATQWRVKGLLPACGVAAIFGASMSGKSFLAFDLLGHIASGLPWFGHRTRQAKCAYLGLEGQSGMANRWKAFQTQYGDASAAYMSFGTAPLNLTRTDELLGLADGLRAMHFYEGVLLIDTLSCAMPGLNENDAGAMSNILAGLHWLSSELTCLVVLVHHTGKALDNGPRGSSVLTANLDSLLEVTYKGGDRLWRPFKVKDGRCQAIHAFNLEVIELGRDEDGDTITSCFIKPGLTASKKISLTKPQKIALDALKRVQTKMAAPPELNDFCQNDTPGLFATKQAWREACYRDGISVGGDDSAKRQAFKRAADRLQELGLVTLSGDWCWATSS